MHRRALDSARLHRLKAASRDLVEAAGGQDRAARLVGVGQATVSRWVSAELLEYVMPTDAVAILEAETGVPVVTRVLAEFAGLALARPDPAARAATMLGALGTLAREGGEAEAAIAEAMADGVVTPGEADRIDREAADVVRSAEVVRDLAARARGRA